MNLPRFSANHPDIMGKAGLLTVLYLFIGTLTGFFSPDKVFAAIVAPNETPRQITPAASQATIQQADIPDLLQKLLKPASQIRAAASESLGAIPPQLKIPALTQALSDPNWKIQVIAAYNLGQTGSNARSAIPALTAALGSPNPDVRFTVAKALGKISSEVVVPPLATALQDKDENVRMAAAIALDNMGLEARAALPVLQKTLRDGNWFVRSHAAAAFVRLAARDQEMLPVLVQAVKNPLQENAVLTGSDQEFRVRRQDEISAVVAIDALAEIGPEVAPHVVQTLKYRDNTPGYLFNVAVTLITIDSKTHNNQAVELLIQALQSSDFDWVKKRDVARALGVIGSKAAIPVLTIPPVTEDKLEALGMIGFKEILGKKIGHIEISKKFYSTPLSYTANPALIAALESDAWQLHAAAVAALVIDSPNAALPSLQKALTDPDWRVRSVAAAALDFRNPSLLINALNDADYRVRLSAVGAIDSRVSLNAFGPINFPDQLRLRLLDHLQDKEEDIRLAAAIKLVKFGGESERAETIVIDSLLHNQDVKKRLEALDALESSRSSPAMSAIIDSLRDNEEVIREKAAFILFNKFKFDSNDYFQETAAAATRALLNVLQDPSAEVRGWAAEALGHAGDVAVPALSDALQDSDWRVRSSAASALGQISSPAAIPVLTAALNDTNEYVRRSAGTSLSRFKSALQDNDKNLDADAWQIRRRAAVNLGLMADPDSNWSDFPIPHLIKALQDPNPNVCASVAATLTSLIIPMGSQPDSSNIAAKLSQNIATGLKQALPNLLVSLKKGDAQARLDIITVLPKLGPAVRAAIPALRDTLADEIWLIRYVAAIALMQINPRDKTASSALAEIFRDPTRVETLKFEDGILPDELWDLRKISSSPAIAAWINLLRFRDADFRYSHYGGKGHCMAAFILTEIGPKAIPGLMNALKNENGRFLAADTLSQIGPSAIPPLTAILRPKPGAESGLREILQEKDADLRRSAVYALGQIGLRYPSHKNVIRGILTCTLSNKNEPDRTRWLAAAFLQEMGQGINFSSEFQNLPKPEADTCIMYDIDSVYSQFDLYSARCLFAGQPDQGGGYELYQTVRNLLTKTPNSVSPQPQPQPATPGR